jgi:hypothetical protein
MDDDHGFILYLLLSLEGNKSVIMIGPMQRRLRIKHHFQIEAPDTGFTAATEVAGLLNKERGGPGMDQIEGLISNINELEQIAKGAQYPRETLKEADEGKLGPRASELVESINFFFDAHQYNATLGNPTPEGWGQGFVFKIAPKRKEGCSQFFGAIILAAAHQGYLGLLRPCRACGLWFAAKRTVHRFCSGGCREKTFRGSTEGRSKRAAYMRGYRQRLRRRDAENLRISRGARRATL